MKKIAFIGNMNNMMYPTAYYLANSGYECTLFTLKEYENFKPDDFDNKVVIRSLLFNDPVDLLSKKDELKKEIDGFDYIIGTDWAPAICTLIGRRLDCFYPAGSDFYDWPIQRWAGFKTLPNIYALKFYLLKYYQFIGIKSCGLLSYAKNVYMRQILKKFGNMESKIMLPLPYLINEVKYKNKLTSDEQATFDSIISKTHGYSNAIVHQTRQQWKVKDILQYGYKGNEILILGFNELLSETKDVCLILFSYGNDVEASKELIRNLGIEEYVIWVPRVSQNVVRAIVESSTIGVGQLGSDWIFYCSAAEILHANIPFICSAKAESFKENDVEQFPQMYSVENSSDLRVALSDCIKNINTKKENINWLDTYNINMPMTRLIKYFENNNSHNSKYFLNYLYILKLKLGIIINTFKIYTNKYI